MFKVVSVFDVSQTDGKPLPVLAHSLSGDVQQYEVFMEALRRTSPVPIVIARTDRDVDGFFVLTAQQITIQDGMSQVQTICAGVHEIAHSKLHNYDKMTELADDGVTVLAPEEKDRHTEEVEAESISYAVCQYFGIETADNSFGYIASWSQGKELKELRASLETINRTSSELISSIEQHFKEICKERGITIDAPAEAVPVVETSPTVSGGDPIVNTDDAISTFAGDFTVHLMIKTNGEPIPGIPAEGIDGICAWVEEKLRAGDLRPLSDILLDMMAIYGRMNASMILQTGLRKSISGSISHKSRWRIPVLPSGMNIGWLVTSTVPHRRIPPTSSSTPTIWMPFYSLARCCSLAPMRNAWNCKRS